jgi:ribosome-associated translation inhibitor RaiA
MELEIRRQNVRLDEGLLEHIERQMGFALDQFNSWISHCSVHVEDVNGTKGGVDKHCRVLVNLKTGKTLKVEDTDAQMIVAVNRAADRISHAVSREVERKRDH